MILIHNKKNIVDNCMFGDTPFTPINGESCDSFIQSQPWQCYVDNVFNTCCQSCLNHRTNDTGKFSFRTPLKLG